MLLCLITFYLSLSHDTSQTPPSGKIMMKKIIENYLKKKCKNNQVPVLFFFFITSCFIL